MASAKYHASRNEMETVNCRMLVECSLNDKVLCQSTVHEKKEKMRTCTVILVSFYLPKFFPVRSS